MKNLTLYTVIPLLGSHIEEVCIDIQKQCDSGAATCPLFMMTLVPEGDPPANKVDNLCERYKIYRKKLSEKGIPSGVLVQASIGHGWKLSAPFPYQRFTGMRDGSTAEVVCPYDSGFQTYIYHVLRRIASCAPDCIMIDDDFRLLGRGTNGCGCPLHMKRFHELSGTNLSREELNQILVSGSNQRYRDIYLETQKESLVKTARIMRLAIDSIDPTIPGSYCCVGNNAEFAYEIASELSGKGNPVVVRINNGNYTAAGSRCLSIPFQKAAAQIAKLKGKADVILAETDTCPQNRYSTGAMQLHAHFTGTILEGAAGAKHWITRLHAFEPESGRAYRKVLAKYSGFYKALAEVVPKLSWLGFRIPILDTAEYQFGADSFDLSADGHSAWSDCVLERLGLPVFFSSDNAGMLCLEGKVLQSDEEIRKALSGTVLLASDSAGELIRRGFGDDIGVDVRPWNGAVPSVEIDCESGNSMDIQQKAVALIPLHEGVAELSTVFHTVDKTNLDRLFPGVTMYRNRLGGTAYVFCGSPKANYNIIEAFSFLNQTRKQQLVKVLKSACRPYVYYPNDEEVYFRAAKIDDGNLFCAVFNIGLDPIERLELVCSEKITAVSVLTPEGTRKSVSFERSSGRYLLDLPCRTLEPVILYICCV